MVRVRVRVRFAFCSLGFSFTEYIHAASFSMWCMVERVDATFDLVPLGEVRVSIRVRVRARRPVPCSCTTARVSSGLIDD